MPTPFQQEVAVLRERIQSYLEEENRLELIRLWATLHILVNRSQYTKKQVPAILNLAQECRELVQSMNADIPADL
jgi:hypothetical protein